jgi:hypothetical protein
MGSGASSTCSTVTFGSHVDKRAEFAKFCLFLKEDEKRTCLVAVHISDFAALRRRPLHLRNATTRCLGILGMECPRRLEAFAVTVKGCLVQEGSSLIVG